MDRVHADRREPDTPDQPIDLGTAIEELLATASEQRSGRAARTLTPGSGARLKQTLVALREGQQMDDHVAPGQATLQVLRGAMTLAWGDERRELSEGSWTPIPSELHRLIATSDSAAMITTVPDT